MLQYTDLGNYVKYIINKIECINRVSCTKKNIMTRNKFGVTRAIHDRRKIVEGDSKIES